MSAQITWTIEWMQTTPTEANPPEFVLSAGWRCSGTQAEGDSAFAGTVYGTCAFKQPETNGTFTPYADLTQEQVLGWCWDSGVDKTAAEANVQGQIDNQINPPVIQPSLPWAQA